MASSKGSPGPHDRRPSSPPRATCVKLTRFGKSCRRFRIKGSKLCKYHGLQAAQLEADPSNPLTNNMTGINAKATPSGAVRAATQTNLKKQNHRINDFVVSAQAKDALRKLGLPDLHAKVDPKQVLLDTVMSAWRQQRVWEALLAIIPEDDYQYLGTPPLPGLPSTSKGARIELIQKLLLETTKVAARTSKLAIDAGIEERLVRLAEEQSNLIADTVRAGIVASLTTLVKLLHLSPEVEAQALEAGLGEAATHLRALAIGGNTTIEGIAEVVDR